MSNVKSVFVDVPSYQLACLHTPGYSCRQLDLAKSTPAGWCGCPTPACAVCEFDACCQFCVDAIYLAVLLIHAVLDPSRRQPATNKT